MSKNKSARLYRRGLTFDEVGFIKVASRRGYSRDYIMSFLIYPGRTLSPACVNDITVKNYEPDVPEISQSEFDQFVAKRLAASKNLESVDQHGPLSTFLIHQELGWALGEQESLLEPEQRRLEFKKELPANDKALSRCLIGMAALANTAGGYVIFGIEDKTKKAIGIGAASWDEYDWDKFSTTLARLFQPSMDWSRRIIELQNKSLGVIYVHQFEIPPIVSIFDWNDIKAATIYFRHARSSERISIGDLMALLSRRDKKIREQYSLQ